MGCEGNKSDTRKFGKNENNKIKMLTVYPPTCSSYFMRLCSVAICHSCIYSCVYTSCCSNYGRQPQQNDFLIKRLSRRKWFFECDKFPCYWLIWPYLSLPFFAWGIYFLRPVKNQYWGFINIFSICTTSNWYWDSLLPVWWLINKVFSSAFLSAGFRFQLPSHVSGSIEESAAIIFSSLAQNLFTQ